MDISQLANLRQAYHELERRVQRALNTQVGDSERLAEVQGEVLSYIQAVEQVCRVFLMSIAVVIRFQHSTRTSSPPKNF